MLILSRKVGEAIIIGGNITVAVARISGNRVTLGIEAPKELNIRRNELPQLVGLQLWEGDKLVKCVQMTKKEAREAGKKFAEGRPGRRYSLVDR